MAMGLFLSETVEVQRTSIMQHVGYDEHRPAAGAEEFDADRVAGTHPNAHAP